jgi:uncharacterized membrane protein
MTSGWAVYLRGFLVGATVFGYYWLAHTVSATQNDDLSATLIGLTPFATLVLALCWRSRQRVMLITGFLLLAAGVAMLWPHLHAHPSWMYFLQHVLSNLLLAWIFGRSLLPGRQALITYFASFVHRPTMSPRVARFTRQATVAWTVFFLSMSAISALLFALAPVEAWSIFANLLALPLVVTMFLGEYLVRRHVLPPHELTSIMGSIRAYRQSFTRTHSNSATSERP